MGPRLEPASASRVADALLADAKTRGGLGLGARAKGLAVLAPRLDEASASRLVRQSQAASGSRPADESTVAAIVPV